jgi:hypothetical protein
VCARGSNLAALEPPDELRSTGARPALLGGPSTHPLGVMAEHFAKWEPVGDISWPCTDITLEIHSQEVHSQEIRALMHFSRTRGAPKLDLSLVFQDAAALRWMRGAFVYATAPHLKDGPRLDTQWNGMWFRFPLLKVVESSWLPTLGYASTDLGHLHYFLVSMHGHLDIAAGPQISARWMTP